MNLPTEQQALGSSDVGLAEFRIVTGLPPVEAQVPERGFSGEVIAWIDIAGELGDHDVKRLLALELNGLGAQAIELARRGLGSDDPRLGAWLDPALVSAAEKLASGNPPLLVHASAPQCPKPIAMPGQTWSLVDRELSILVGDSWLLTWRRRPFDVRFAIQPMLRPIPRRQLVELLSATTPGMRPADLAQLLLQWTAREAFSGVQSILREIDNRSLDVQRALAGEAPKSEAVRPVLEFLYHLRSSLDALESRLRGLTPELNPARKRVGELSQIVGRVEPDPMREALERCTEGRRRLEGISAWIAGVQTAALIEAQVEAGERSGRLQTLVALIATLFLGPTLVATIFGASPTWWDGHQGLRGGMLAVFTLVSIVVVGLLLWLVLARGRYVRGVSGNPVHLLPYRLARVEINRRLPRNGSRPDRP